jgi:hypothetical protein
VQLGLGVYFLRNAYRDFHLKELNHSKEFWGLLEKIGYDKSGVKSKIKEYSFVLQIL